MKNFLVVFLLFGVLYSFSQDNVDRLIFEKNFTEALSKLDKMIENKPSATLYYKKGLILSNLQYYQEAIKSYTQAARLNPENGEITTEMADAYATLGDNDEAVKLYQKVLKVDSTNLQAAGKLGKTLIVMNKMSEAYNVFSALYQKDSSNVYWNRQYAFCSFKTDNTSRAIWLYNKVLDANPADVGSIINLSRVFSGKKDSILPGIEVILKGLSALPQNKVLTFELANLWFRKKDYVQAKKTFEEYFRITGDTAKINALYGYSLYYCKKAEEAINILNKCMIVNPNDPLVWFYIALGYKELKDMKSAEYFMKIAIETAQSPFIADFYHHLGLIYDEQRKFPEAISSFKKTLEYDPASAEVYFDLASTYEEYQADKSLALTYYKLYLEKADPESKNRKYASDRINRINEKLFFEKGKEFRK